MGRGRGFSTIEILVAAVVGLLFIGLAYSALHGLNRGQVAADQRSTRALLEAQLHETVFRDLRSLVGEVSSDGPPGARSWRFERSVHRDGPLTTVRVEWRQVDGTRIERIEDVDGARRTQTFDFRGLLDPSRPTLDFAIEPADDLVAVPADAPHGGSAP